MHPHATGEDLLRLRVVAALLLLREVIAEHLRPFADQPFGGRLGQARRFVPPLGIRGHVALGPVGPEQEHRVRLDRDALRAQGALGPLEIFGADARVRGALEGEIHDDGLADHRLEGNLLHTRHVAKEVMRRIDVRPRMHRHLDEIGDETLLLPRHDRPELEVVLVLGEGRGVAFFHGHAEVHDAHCSLLFPQATVTAA